MLLLDGREGPSRVELEGLRHKVRLIAAIDDGSDRRLACDFAYYPPLPQGVRTGLDRRAHRGRASAGNMRCWGSIRI